MAERWVTSPSGSKFPVISKTDNTVRHLRSSNGGPMLRIGYPINPSGSSSSYTENDTISSFDPYKNNVLDCESFEFTIGDWLARNKLFRNEVFLVNTVVGNSQKWEQIARPTKEALAIVKALFEAVADLHSKNCKLFYPLSFGVNTLSNKEDNHCELEIVIIQGSCRKPGIDNALQSYHRDVTSMYNFAFGTILKIPSADYFINLKAGCPDPRLPKGLCNLMAHMETTCRHGGAHTSSLEFFARYYSLLNWEKRMNDLSGLHDKGTCPNSSLVIDWFGALGVRNKNLCQLLNEPKSLNIRRYGKTRGELLRFVRDCFHHLHKKWYCDPEHLSPEYLECELAEIFNAFYEDFQL